MAGLFELFTIDTYRTVHVFEYGIEQLYVARIPGKGPYGIIQVRGSVYRTVNMQGALDLDLDLPVNPFSTTPVSGSTADWVVPVPGLAIGRENAGNEQRSRVEPLRPSRSTPDGGGERGNAGVSEDSRYQTSEITSCDESTHSKSQATRAHRSSQSRQ